MNRRHMAWTLAGVLCALAGADQARAARIHPPAEAPSADSGYLTVTSEPPARLFVDDVDTGSVTPVVRYAVKAGRHKVTLVSLDGKMRRSLGIVVAAGKEQKLNVNL